MLTEQQRRRLGVWVTSVVASGVIAIGCHTPQATAQTLAWDPSPDAAVAGYRVRYGPTPTGFDAAVDVGNSVEGSLAWLPRDRAWFLCVEAYTRDQFTSACSDQVILMPSGDGIAARPFESYAAWSARWSAGAEDADPDADGVSNRDEHSARTDPFIPNRWWLAEGATGPFRQEIALANPGDDPAVVRLRFLRDDGVTIETHAALGPNSRETVVVNDIPGLAAASAGVELTGQSGGVVSERTMTWTAPGGTRPAHSAKAVAAPSTDWYFAEGEVGVTDTWFLVANAGASAARATFEFMTDAGVVVERTYDLVAGARLSVWANAIPALRNRSFATTVRTTRPVIAERAVYFWSGAAGWRGGHVSAGAPAPAKRWFVAEGRTGPFFDTYVLIGNPGAVPVSATLRYLTPQGVARTDRVDIAARSRLTIPVDLLPGLSDTDVSVDVTATGPVVVERSMYWPGDASTWREGHNSVALTDLGTRWVLAEGRWLGSEKAETYVLIANPGGTAALIGVRVLREAGRSPISSSLVVGPNSRETLRIDDTVGVLPGERFAVEISSSQPIGVERSIYTSVGGTWTAGTNEVAVRLR